MTQLQAGHKQVAKLQSLAAVAAGTTSGDSKEADAQRRRALQVWCPQSRRAFSDVPLAMQVEVMAEEQLDVFGAGVHDTGKGITDKALLVRGCRALQF